MPGKSEGYGSFNGYDPIETKSDERAKKVKAVVERIDGALERADRHLNHRLSFKTFCREVFNHFADKVIPQGADELANAMFNHSAYLPWPGSSGPRPIAAPPMEPETPQPLDLPAITGPAIEPPDPYLTGDYKPQAPESPGGAGGLYLSYVEQLEQSASWGGDTDRGHSR